MNDTPQENQERQTTGNLTDFVVGLEDSDQLDIEVAIKEDGRVVVFHSHPFKQELAWFEFDLGNNKLDFILDDGDIRDIGLPLTEDVSKHMQNSHQVLTIQMDPQTGEAQTGKYIPLIIHRA